MHTIGISYSNYKKWGRVSRSHHLDLAMKNTNEKIFGAEVKLTARRQQTEIAHCFGAMKWKIFIRLILSLTVYKGPELFKNLFKVL